MADGKFIKGALVSFMPTFLGSVPNVIIFQFNPESLTHGWTETARKGGGGASDKEGSDPMAIGGPPGEDFSFTLMLDANEMLPDFARNPVAGALATAVGV